MLAYLVTSVTRRSLLVALWTDGRSGSVRQLARFTGTAYAATHRELTAMWQAGLASRRRKGNSLVFSANHEHAQARLLSAMMEADHRGIEPARDGGDHDAAVRESLIDLGAPLLATSQTGPGSVETLIPEAAVAAGVELARRDATVARALPVAIYGARDALDPDLLLRQARQRTDPQAVGMFLALTAALGSCRRLARVARRFRDRRRSRRQDFFLAASSRLQRELADLNTPEVVAAWGYRMNLGLDAFESTFRRFAIAGGTADPETR